MSRHTVFSCDRCGLEARDRFAFVSIGPVGGNVSITADFCASCALSVFTPAGIDEVEEKFRDRMSDRQDKLRDLLVADRGVADGT